MGEWNVTSVIAVGSFLLGAVGTTLGIVNFLRDIARSRVRLRVIPKLSFSVDGGLLSFTTSKHLAGRISLGDQNYLGIEVVNLSAFPVTIEEIGFCDKDPRKSERSVIRVPLLPNGESWPVRLEPRASFTGYCEFHDFVLHNPLSHFNRAYAVTSCEEFGWGKSEIMNVVKSFAKQLREQNQ